MDSDALAGDTDTAPLDTQEQKLNKIRGWLLVFFIMLIPHTPQSLMLVIKEWPIVFDADPSYSMLRVETLRLVTHVVMFLGHSMSLVLIVTRNRYTPAFITVYLALLFFLTIVDPDIAATQVANIETLGISNPPDASFLAGARWVGIATAPILWGYWLRSKRVRAVFGSVGLGVFRRSTRGAAN